MVVFLYIKTNIGWTYSLCKMHALVKSDYWSCILVYNNNREVLEDLLTGFHFQIRKAAVLLSYWKSINS